MPRSCKIRFGGGIGNQLYQLAFLWFLRTKNINAEPDFSEFTYYSFHNGLEINKILNTEYKDEIDHTEHSRQNWYKMFNQKLGFWLRFKFYQLRNSLCYQQINEDESCSFDLRTIDNQKKQILHGHWQRLEYVEPVKEQFFKNLNYQLLSTSRDKDIVEQIKGTTSISIHIRRGDYLKESKYLVIKDFSYYEKAIAYMKTKYENPKFFVFSDDMDWVKKNIKEENVVFVDWNHGADSFKDMLLMSLCQHNIIANSTFSWWGAFLNPNRKKTVVCPSYWLVGEKTTGRVPADWIQLDA